MQAGGRSAVRVGCSGWSYASWKDEFYGGLPARAWLERYARSFDTVEVNATFYRLPSPDTVASWERTVPPGFLFTVKVSRYLTHVKRLRDLGPGLERFLESLAPLLATPKMGPLLWQLPATFKADHARLEAALALLPRAQRHCVEFRHPSWFTEETYALLRAREVALVIGDRPEVRPFQAHVFTAPWTLVRFHYGSRGRDGSYGEAELEEWAARFERWSREVEVLAYFNNDWEAFAVRNALRLKELLGSPASP